MRAPGCFIQQGKSIISIGTLTRPWRSSTLPIVSHANIQRSHIYNGKRFSENFVLNICKSFSVPSVTRNSRVLERMDRIQASISDDVVEATEGHLYLGFDFGTSGGRAMVIDGQGELFADTKVLYPVSSSGIIDCV